MSSLSSLSQPARTTCHPSNFNNLLAGALGDQSRSFLADGESETRNKVKKNPPQCPKEICFLEGKTSPISLHMQPQQELFLKQSSFILIKSRCSFKAAVATKIAKELPPAKSRAPELSKGLTKLRKQQPTWLETKFLFKSKPHI